MLVFFFVVSIANGEVYPSRRHQGLRLLPCNNDGAGDVLSKGAVKLGDFGDLGHCPELSFPDCVYFCAAFAAIRETQMVPSQVQFELAGTYN